jgi:predicted ATPase
MGDSFGRDRAEGVDPGGEPLRGAFIGRDRELAELVAGLQDAIEGRGGVLLITGEAGIGKTAVAEQLTSHSVERGALVLRGRCWEGAGAPPYWPWAQIVRTLAGEHDDETVRSFASSGSGQITLLVPDLAARLGESTDRVSLIESDAGRFYLFEAVARFLRNASTVRPLVIVLDDSTLSITRRSFCSGSWRGTSGVRGCSWWPLTARRMLLGLPRRRTCLRLSPARVSVLSLQSLDREEVGRLVEQVLGSVPWQGNVSTIYEATEGNPLFVRKVTRLVATQDHLDRHGRLSVPIP